MAKTTAVLEVFIESVKPLAKKTEETDGMQKSKVALGHRFKSLHFDDRL